jgi:MFS family permease
VNARAGTSADDRLVTTTFVVVTASALFYFIGLGALQPVVPRYVEDELGGGGLSVGIAVGAFAISAALLRPWVGRVGDRRGRRLLVMGGAAVVGASVLGYGLGHSLAVLVGMRLVSGAGEAAVFVGAATAVQDLAPARRRGEAASYFSVAIYGGVAVGPLLGEAMRDARGFGSVWIVTAVCCAVAVLLGRWVPAGPVHDGGGSDAGDELARASSPRRLLHPAAVRPGVVLLLSLIGLAGFIAFMPLYVDELGLDTSGPLFAVYAVVILTVRIGGGRLPDRLGPVRASTSALCLQVAGLAFMAAWASIVGLVTGTVLFALGASLLFPSLFPLVVGEAPEAERSHAIGSFSVFFDLSQGLGAPLLGVVVALSGERAAFAAAAVCSLVALELLRRWRGQWHELAAA